MDRNILGYHLLNILQTKFPGGTEAFTSEGGFIQDVPFDKNSVYLYHPNIPVSFRRVIEEFNDDNDINIIIVETCNFENHNPITTIRSLQVIGNTLQEKYNLKVLLYNPLSPITLVINIPYDALSMEMIEDMSQTFLSKMPELIRGVIVTGYDVFPFSRETETIKTPLPKVILEPERTDITKEAITDLKITLANDLDVMDFIKML